MIARLMMMIYASLRINFNFSSFLIFFFFFLSQLVRFFVKKTPQSLASKLQFSFSFLLPAESKTRKVIFPLTPINLQSTNLIYFFSFFSDQRAKPSKVFAFLRYFSFSNFSKSAIKIFIFV